MKNDERITILKGIVNNLPESPGIYQYLNSEHRVIYVGKAKNLKRRVSSYFNKDQINAKTRILVTKIWDIKYIVVKNEEDALLLENNLIKQYKPKYNVLLKDDKTYPSICIAKENFARVYKTRRIEPKHGFYFGPYSHISSMYNILELIKKMYPLRTCNLKLNEENIKSGKFKPCLEYHIKNCKAPCIGAQTLEEYQENIEEIKDILKGDTRKIAESLKEKMSKFSEELRFEEAQKEKEKLMLLESYQSKSEVVNSINNNIDVFAIESEENTAYINYLHITRGCINRAFTFEYKKKLEESDKELLQWGIIEMRSRYNSTAKEIIVPFELELELDGVTFNIPQRGEKKHLLELSIMNVKQYKFDRLKQAEKLNPEQKKTKILKELQRKLNLVKLPIHIECFDNSNIQGKDAVAGCVVFRMGKPSKKEYRKYNIKTVKDPDDYASMHEVVSRRYSRLINEGQELPDLIIADGGKGQMEIIREVIEDELKLAIPIAGLVKDGKHKTSELLYGFPTQVVGIEQDTALFHMLENIQDEVHRFAITFHRDKRSKSQMESQLDGIKGIGPKKKSDLLKRFKSLARIAKANIEELSMVVGNSAAMRVKEQLSKNYKI